MEEIEMNLKEKIRTIPHFPRKGVMFRDITTLLKDPEAFDYVIEKFVERYKDKNIDKVAGIESRGFIFGSILVYRLGKGFVPIRKPSKLPAKTTKIEYELEYGKDALEIHNDAIEKGDRVLIIDDLIASGGTLLAAAELIEKLGGKVESIGVLIDLPI